MIAGMVKLGFWQYGKAEQKKVLQAVFDARLLEAPRALPDKVVNIEEWRYRKLQAVGQYEPANQIFLDNQVESGAAGYHVITPFRAKGSGALLLVDRGWVPMGDRSQLPQVGIPEGVLTVTGFAWVPSNKFYELAKPQESAQWQPVWENMDMVRYQKLIREPVLPFVLRLDSSSAGGFLRNWVMPAERIETHIGYAWQWWGFSVALFLIWIFVNVKKEAS